MKKTVTLVVELPDIDASDYEVSEFIEFALGAGCQMDTKNPFVGEELEIIDCNIENYATTHRP